MQFSRNRNPFRNLFERVICCVLLLGIPCCTSQPTYKRQDHRTGETLVCHQCPPGMHLYRECTKDTLTICKPCPDLHYTRYWNYLNRCLYCNIFCNSLEEESQACNGTHNRACQCKAGYYSDSDFCIKHSNCPLGTGVTQLGNPQEDTKCAPCPQGTFSCSFSSTDPCQSHQNCSAQGLEVNVPGNQFHDTICTPCKLKKANDTSDRADDMSGNRDDCQEAVIDFVPYQVGSHRRLQRLKRILSGVLPANGSNKKSPAELQVELHTYLIQLKNTHGKEFVVRKLLGALKRMKLQHVQQKIQKRFSLSL
ncbi:tumor necrosis factor receptor superfamily member 6B [Rhineura floridana]|uniref:tumor necrosis factor receptor superfamily member 6B n=1 Tax=Rhineura floridana TaxID=261503 RepID=UPI002AC81179|nr:tumor necrosis factor receptor superfamily member 6B [Rhineura floridana]XP_061486206.1 tumor necrosis factor receptor superfamily member 6B [Rhineura floridana]XP_061486207.1 tumor necrosis factor receptor superfamily member 6B [Rhineura floridana]